jgi:hypothetical protein
VFERVAHALQTGTTMLHLGRRLIAPLLVAAGLCALPVTSDAQEVVVRERVYYPIEVEPHFSFGNEDVFGSIGFGGGLRLGVPLARGHIGRIPQNIALSFGGDIVHYEDCYNGTGCSANYLMFPVAAQWNIGFARGFSFLVEGGGYVYKGWYDTCGPACAPSDLGVLPTVAVGGRVHVHDNVAFLFRIGYPMSTVGISFL